MKVYKNKRHPINYNLGELTKNELECINEALKYYIEEIKITKSGVKNSSFHTQVKIGNIDSILTELESLFPH